MQVREEHEPLAQARVLGRDRLLHLQQELRVLPDLVDRGDPRADRLVGGVGEGAAVAGAGLDDHLVAALDELERARGRQRDAVLVRLDLLGDADPHGRQRYRVAKLLRTQEKSPHSSEPVTLSRLPETAPPLRRDPPSVGRGVGGGSATSSSRDLARRADEALSAAREPLHVARSSRPSHGGEPARAFSRVRRAGRRRDDDVDPLVRERPLEQRLRPRLDAELPQRLERPRARRPPQEPLPPPSGRITITATPSSAASGSSRARTRARAGCSGIWTASKRPRPQRALELAERRRSLVRHAEPADPPRARAPPRATAGAPARRRGCAPARSRRGRTTRAGASNCWRASVDRAAPDLRRHDASSRRPSSAAAERPLRRAVHRRRVEARSPASSAAPTTSRGERARRRRTCSTCRGRRPGRAAAAPSADAAARDRARRERGAKNHGSSSGPRPMCVERQSGARCSSPRRRRRRSDVAREPDGQAIAARQSSSTARRVVRDAAVALARVAARDADGERRAGRRARSPRWLRRRARAPPWPRREPVPTIPGPTAHTTASSPRAFAHASAEAPVSASTSPSKHGATATAVSSRPRSFSARTVSESATGNAPPASCTYATRTPRSAGADRRDLAVQRAADDGQPVELARRARPPPPRGARASWTGVYGSSITCAPGSGGSPSPRVRFA